MLLCITVLQCPAIDLVLSLCVLHTVGTVELKCHVSKYLLNWLTNKHGLHKKALKLWKKMFYHIFYLVQNIIS